MVTNGTSADLVLFTGSANPKLAENISRGLRVPLSKANLSRFSDGEISVEIDENVRGKDVFIIQPTCAPPNRNLMELLLIADALRRSSAERITAVTPYLGYSRQDRRTRYKRVPISGRVIADMISNVGIARLLTVDLHAEQMQGFFGIPVDNVYGAPLFLEDIKRGGYGSDQELNKEPIVVSPDIGGVMRARAIAKQLKDLDLAIIDKRRPRRNESRVMNVIGDVDGRCCLIVDDIVDTAGTLCSAASALKQQGASRVVAYCTHAVLSGSAVDNIEGSDLDALIVTDTIPLGEQARACSRIRSLSTAALLAEAIRRVRNAESISALESISPLFDQ